MDIINKMKPIAFFNSSIGELAIFELTLNDQIEIYKSFNDNLENSTTEEFMNVFARYACHKKNDLDENLSKPYNPTLSSELTKNLTPSDLENIAKLFLQKNDYLYKNQESITKNVDGKNVTTFRSGEIIIPKREDETSRKYLHRLSILEKTRNEELIKNSFASITSFSRGLQESLKRNMTIGEQLSKAIKSIQSYTNPKIEPIIPKGPDLHKLITNETKAKNVVFETSSKLDSLINIAAKYIPYLIEANNLQSSIANEIKKSSDTSTRFSKQNIYISRTVLIIGILSFIFSIFSMTLNNQSNSKVAKDVLKGIDSLNTNTISFRKIYLENLKEIEYLKNQIDSLKIDNQSLRSQIKINLKEKLNNSH